MRIEVALSTKMGVKSTLLFYNHPPMWSLRVCIAICLLLGIRGVGIAWVVLTNLAQYRELNVAGAWPLRVVLYSAWGIWFLWLAWGLQWRHRGAYRALLPSLAVFTTFDVAWFALFAQATYDKRRLPFVVVTSILFMGLAWWLRIRSQF